ncbi:MAG: hypothetical protein JOY99_03715 [Sphingomonadaceae bacterium]|nr:hypothetical protein [Sphingomonadaceae bacterium]
MILGVIISLTGVFLLVALMFQMAVFALPLFAGVSAGRLAYDSGAGWLGAILIGLLGALFTLGIGQLVLALTKSTALRLAVMLVFAAPAAFAGYHVVLGLTRIGGAHGAWQVAFASIGAVAIAAAALARLATPLIPLDQPQRA